MKKLTLLLLIIIKCSCINAQSLVGIWQLNTPEVSSGYLDTYQFFSNGTFRFNSSQYNALRRVITIGGKYKVQKDKVTFLVEYTMEKVGGVFKVGDVSSGSDSWSITGGQIKRVPLLKTLTQYASIETGIKDKEVDVIKINKAKYYKVDNDPENFQ